MLIDKAIVSYADEQTLPEQAQPFLRDAVYDYVGCYGAPVYERARDLFCEDHYALRAIRNLEEHAYRLHRFCSVNKAFLLTLAGANLAVAQLQTRQAAIYSAKHSACSVPHDVCKQLYNKPPCSLSQLISAYRNLHPLSSQGPASVLLPQHVRDRDASLRSMRYRRTLLHNGPCAPDAKRFKPEGWSCNSSEAEEQLLTCADAESTDKTRLAYSDANMVYLQTICEGMYTSARLMVDCMHKSGECDDGPKCLIKLQHHLSLIQTALAELAAHLAACCDGDTDPLICCINAPDITAADVPALIIEHKLLDCL